jgi:hypothetical protein
VFYLIHVKTQAGWFELRNTDVILLRSIPSVKD